jgi:hypothetical protein
MNKKLKMNTENRSKYNNSQQAASSTKAFTNSQSLMKEKSTRDTVTSKNNESFFIKFKLYDSTVIDNDAKNSEMCKSSEGTTMKHHKQLRLPKISKNCDNGHPDDQN